jgi:hypothetical protein
MHVREQDVAGTRAGPSKASSLKHLAAPWGLGAQNLRAGVLVGLSALLAGTVVGSAAGSGPAWMIASGSFRLPPASSSASPNLHRVVTIPMRLPEKLPLTRGLVLVVSLRDSSRGALRCLPLQPNRGCATVDWSDNPRQLRTPPNGVFEDSITIGHQKLYLHQSGALSSLPEQFVRAGSQTPIDGLGRRWAAELVRDFPPGTPLRLRLVMTKVGRPDVRIAYNVHLERQRRKIL